MKEIKNLKPARGHGGGRKLLGRAIVTGLCLLALAACATGSTAARDKSLQQRAQARWDALLAKDYAKAYSYATPGYRSSASVTDFEMAMRLRRVQYVSAEYKEHHCEETVCNVQIEVGYKVVRPVSGLPEWSSSSQIEERWIKTDGNWWFVPES